ncbi:MAG: hypothetical protein OEM39_02355, partial [Acidimicrobiia bacterium]|nr:hypothetical protein [Acidimicrobiia bacterium]
MPSKRLTRFFGLAVALALALTLVPFSGSSLPAAATLNEVPLTWKVDSVTSLSQEIEQPATSVGLTWESARPDSAWFRVRTEGAWGPWENLPIEDSHGPDPGTDEAVRSKPSSDLVWVGAVDAVQFLVSGEVEGTSAVLIDTSDRNRPLSRRIQ